MQHEESAQQGDGEADSEQIELRRRARDDAERQVDDDQRDDRRQGDQQAGLEDPRAPQHHGQQEIPVDVRGADRQGLKALRQRAEQHQMAIDREVREDADDHEQLAEHRGLARRAADPPASRSPGPW